MSAQRRECPCACPYIFGCVGALLCVASVVAIVAAFVVGFDTDESWLVVALMIIVAALLCTFAVSACYLEPAVQRQLNRRRVTKA